MKKGAQLRKAKPVAKRGRKATGLHRQPGYLKRELGFFRISHGISQVSAWFLYLRSGFSALLFEDLKAKPFGFAIICQKEVKG